MIKTIAFANEKGGVAKTTSALSTGIALTEQGKRVLLVDLDPQANLSLILGAFQRTGNHSISSVLLSNRTVSNIKRATRFENLDILPSNQDLHLAERYLPFRENFSCILKNKLAGLNDYDIILIDCPPSLGVLTLNALNASNLLIIPTQCEYFSAHALQTMLDLIRTVRRESNPLLRYRVLLTMFEQQDTVHRALHERIRHVFGDAVFNSTIVHNQLVRKGQVNHQPIVTYAPESNVAVQYRNLAKEIACYVSESIQ